MRRSAVAALSGAILLAGVGPSLGAAPGEQAAGPVIRARYLMGTVFRIEAPPGADASATGLALEAALDEVARWERILSNWDSESEVSRLNARRGRGPTKVSAGLLQAVAASLEWAAATGGAFDPTVEPLTRPFRGKAPAPSEVTYPRDRPRWTEVTIDRRQGTVSIPPGSGLDFGGIGKGIALDRAAEVLRRRGVAAALLDAGGQVLALGSPPGEAGWRIGVADPVDRDRPALSLVLSNASAATSGNAERPGEILDPATGRSVGGSGSATAIAPLATSADALSTALFVMGTQRGTEYASQREDLIALFVQPSSRTGGAARVAGNLPGDPGRVRFLILGPEDPADRRLRVEVR